MKLFPFFIISTIMLVASPAQKSSTSIKQRLCKNWVAYEMEYREPMTRKKNTNPVDANHYDTLLLQLNGTYYRHTNDVIYRGKWAMNADSTQLIVLPTHPIHKGGDVIQELTDSTLQLTSLWGKEGETVITRYHLLERK